MTAKNNMPLSWRRRPRAVGLALVALALLGGCASAPRDPYDPFEPLNRKVFAFNQTADRFVVRPVSKAYDKVTPDPVKTGISNFFFNFATPVWALNHALQGDFAEAGKQSSRFLLNSTLGLLGIFDLAADAGIERQRTTFDTTFGKWGIPSGPFIMVPILGPNTPRSGLGWYARFQTDVIWNYLDDNRSVRDKLVVLDIVDTRRQLFRIDRMMEEAPDPYIFLREAFRQRTEYAIQGPPEEDDYDFGLDDEE